MKQSNPINIVQIDHIVIRARDIEAMVAFYQDVLGCKLERGPFENGLCQLRAGASLIDLVNLASPLGEAGGGDPDPNRPNMDHFCLQVQPWDIAEITRHLKRHGVDVGEVASRYGAQGQGSSIYLCDPEGNRVELKASA